MRITSTILDKDKEISGTEPYFTLFKNVYQE